MTYSRFMAALVVTTWSIAQAGAAHQPSSREHVLLFTASAAAGFNPADSTTYSFGEGATLNPETPADGVRRVICPVTGTVVKAFFNVQVGGTLGSSENVTLTVSNVTAGTTQNISTSAQWTGAELVFSNTAMTLAVTAGDRLTVRFTTPAWVTNPTTTYYSATVVVRSST